MMNIIVCVKGVNSNLVKYTDKRSNSSKVLNPYDVYALKEAYKIKKMLNGTITCISMDNQLVDDVLRQCISMGVDSVYRISDSSFAGSDTVATTLILSTAIKKLGSFDLIICGGKAIDGATSQVGPGLAARLNIPSIMQVYSLVNIDKENIICSVKNQKQVEYIEAKLPVVISYNDFSTNFQARSLLDLRNSYNADIKIFDREYLDLDKDLCGLSGSKTKVISSYVPKINKKTHIISGGIHEEASEILKILYQNY